MRRLLGRTGRLVRIHRCRSRRWCLARSNW
jgi:hypothetical protein